MTDNPPETELDVTSLLCPLPVLKARKRLESMQPGDVLKVVASDPMSAIDMPHFCQQQGHALLSHETLDDTRGALHIFRIRRK